MTLDQLLSVFAAGWRTLAGAVVVCGLAAGAGSLLLARSYTATAAVLVDGRGGDAIGAVDRTQVSNQTLMATQMDLMSSERVARRVVERLGLADDPALRRRWQHDTAGLGDAQAYIAQLLLRQLDLRPSRDSTVVNLSFTDRDAGRAAVAVNAFAQAYIDTCLDIRVEPARQYAIWFDERTRRLRQDLAQAQSRLGAYQRERGVLNTAQGQVDLESSKLAQLTSRLLELEALRGESASRRVQADTNAGASPDLFNHPAVAALRAEVARGEATLGQLGQQLGDRHPQVEGARAQLFTLRQQLEAELRAVRSAVAGSDNVVARREAEVRAALATQRQRVMGLTQSQDQLSVLQRDVENAQHALDLSAARQSQAALESQLTQTNVYLLTPATLPTRPSNPKDLLNAVTAALLGGLLAMGWLLWREHRNPLLRSADDLADCLDLPLLAVVTAARLPDDAGGKRHRWLPWPLRADRRTARAAPALASTGGHRWT